METVPVLVSVEISTSNVAFLLFIGRLLRFFSYSPCFLYEEAFERLKKIRKQFSSVLIIVNMNELKEKKKFETKINSQVKFTHFLGQCKYYRYRAVAFAFEGYFRPANEYFRHFERVPGIENIVVVKFPQS